MEDYISPELFDRMRRVACQDPPSDPEVRVSSKANEVVEQAILRLFGSARRDNYRHAWVMSLPPGEMRAVPRLVFRKLVHRSLGVTLGPHPYLAHLGWRVMVVHACKYPEGCRWEKEIEAP